MSESTCLLDILGYTLLGTAHSVPVEQFYAIALQPGTAYMPTLPSGHNMVINVYLDICAYMYINTVIIYTLPAGHNMVIIHTQVIAGSPYPSLHHCSVCCRLLWVLSRKRSV